VVQLTPSLIKPLDAHLLWRAQKKTQHPVSRVLRFYLQALPGLCLNKPADAA
jgi:hypothetical protein